MPQIVAAAPILPAWSEKPNPPFEHRWQKFIVFSRSLT
jgi:hypothetical protein